MTDIRSLPPKTDLLIVGGGPAGMAAALEATGMGIDVLVVDENPAPGGQIYRSVERDLLQGRGILDDDYRSGGQLAQQFAACGCKIGFSTTVWSIEAGGAEAAFRVGLSQRDYARTIFANAIIVAPGALERPFPIPGWTLPGVMTAGAVQALLKGNAVVPDGPVVLAGTGPLLLLMAAECVRSGVPVTALLDTTPWRNWFRALPHFASFLCSPWVWKGIRLLLEVRSKTRIISGVTSIEALGEEQLQEVRFTVGGRTQTIPATTLLLHQGVVPHTNLAMAAGCEHHWNDRRLCFEPVVDVYCETGITGLFVAGDGAAVGGAKAAEKQGRLAALGVAKRLGRVNPEAAEASALPIRAALRRDLRGRSFLDVAYRPAGNFRIPDDRVTVCRCEGVSAGSIRAATKRGAQGPNQVKTFLRSGMGPCQGRLCGLTLTEIMADTSGRPPGEIGYYHLRYPIKPITLGALAWLDSSEIPAPSRKGTPNHL